MKKKHFALLLAVAAGSAMLLAGCAGAGSTPGGTTPGGDPSSGGQTPGGVQSYVMEAEYINLDGVQGAGISSDQGGVEMIYGDGTQAQKDLGWSNGYYVGYTYSTNLKLDFVFEADKDAVATIVLRLGSELGNITLDPDSFSVRLNGTEISYQSIYLENSSMETMKFFDKTVTAAAQLKAGANTLSLVVLANELKSGSTGGPTVDCVKIETGAKLTWTDKTENPANRGGGPF